MPPKSAQTPKRKSSSNNVAPPPATNKATPASTSSTANSKGSQAKSPTFYNGPTESTASKAAAAKGVVVDPKKAEEKVKAHVKALKGSAPSSFLGRWLYRSVISYTLLALFFCPPNVSSSNSAICSPATKYHSIVQPYVQPHLDHVRSSVISAAQPYYAPYSPYVHSVQATVVPYVQKVIDLATPHVAAGRTLGVNNYKRHLAPRVHYAQLRLSNAIRPYVHELQLRWKILIQPYIDLAHRKISATYNAVEQDPRVKLVRKRTGELIVSGWENGKPLAIRGAQAGKHHWYNTIIPVSQKSFDAGKKHGYAGGVASARFASFVERHHVRPQLIKLSNLYLTRVYRPYLAVYLDPIIDTLTPYVSTSYNLTATTLHRAAVVVQKNVLKTPPPPPAPTTLFGKIKEAVHPAPVVEEPASFFEQARDKVESAFERVSDGAASILGEQTEEVRESVNKLTKKENEEVQKLKTNDEGNDKVQETVVVEAEKTKEQEQPAEPIFSILPIEVPEQNIEEELAAVEREESTNEQAETHVASNFMVSATHVPLYTPEEEADEDLAFLAELEAAEDPSTVIVPTIEEPELVPLPDEQETDDQRVEREAEKKKAIRLVREEIERKHKDFEEKIKKVGEFEEDKLVKTLFDVRSRAVAAFGPLSESWIVTLEKSASKLSTSLEKYLARPNLKQDDINNALEKAKERLNAKVDTVGENVVQWLAEVEGKETEAADAAGEKVDAVASEAASALGIIYAWLEDVTRHDWTRYHNLTRTAELWNELFVQHATQDGTHPLLSSSNSSMASVVQTFRESLEDVQGGFSARVGIIKTNAMLRADAAERKAKGLTEADEPTFSGLPIWDIISGGGEAIGGAAEAVASSGIIGKSKEQIVEALRAAGSVLPAGSSQTETVEEEGEIVKESAGRLAGALGTVGETLSGLASGVASKEADKKDEL
ncbi:hypothetical protein [Phaffia rhodozyma]|uniref:Uncharacterized protein n=1 Tax=Phaffia rhodozyma TaxID=264483 RepID=A0A0F7SVB6_PHARH|nr:hypothetical protein [Phaffia rhodozyma]